MKKYLNNCMNGWICLDKAGDMSSNAAMINVRKILNCKTGYVGTLDPFATGVLPIALGEACKFIPYIEESKKTYIFTMIFGVTTDSLDIKGKITERSDNIPTKENLMEVLQSFTGMYNQSPPLFSAVKINGKRACDRVRNGEKIQLSPRSVIIFMLELLEYISDHEVSLKVTCSKGTYIRSLAKDIATVLGTVAYVKKLKRIKSGFFCINNAITLEKLSKMKDTNKLLGAIIPIESPLDDIPALYLANEHITKLQNGLCISCDNFDLKSENVRIFSMDDQKFKGIGAMSCDKMLHALRMCRNS